MKAMGKQTSENGRFSMRVSTGAKNVSGSGWHAGTTVESIVGELYVAVLSGRISLKLRPIGWDYDF
jgi:hypothetical protein